ncbi:alpha/beta hydrolase [Enterococcus sp. HY326]|uniref:alpha/beta hydrolase n=1 Tax=Enterococcus sp. HY326 TaxID=2971265 RepID=UPI00223F92D5|nr:alpha/beta hydrolase [Enterococcus sp. HY326]
MHNPGELVPVVDGQMNILTLGTGNKTIIFLSGGLTSSPILDFKTLYFYLQNNFKIVVIEKFGYGFSSDSNSSRKIDTMLQQTRYLLAAKQIQPPYILAPHSMSGLEALRWIQEYPDEVEGLIGLDMANYEAYDILKINLFGFKLSRLMVKIKFTKLFPKMIDSDAVKFGNLSNVEKNAFNKMFYKNFTSTAVLNEVITVKENAEKVKTVSLNQIPLLVFSSNGIGTGIKPTTWLTIQKRISELSDVSKLVAFDCPHYVHNHKALEIADEIKKVFGNYND